MFDRFTSRFKIDTRTGIVKFKTKPDFESGKTKYNFQAYVKDKGGNSAVQNITIFIRNINDRS
jgi:hypothetical protein